MPSPRSWDDPWKKYPASKPKRPEQGIATSKQRGEMATSWWSTRLVSLLASYGLGSRMQRGRRYARQGQLVSFEVRPGLLVARVQGSRRSPYVVTVAAQSLSDAQWAKVHDALVSRIGFVAHLLAGEVPPELEAVFDEAGVALLPRHWSDLEADCSCPDWENPCKHIAAVLYVFADRLDDDPWLLLHWRGRQRDQILAHLRAPAGVVAAIAPWWPLVPQAPLPPADEGARAGVAPWSLADPAAALTRLGPLEVTIRSRPVTDVLADLYTAIAEGGQDAAR